MMKIEEQRKRKLVYILLALLVSVSVWFYVDEFDGHTVEVTVSNVPITYTGADHLAERGLMMLEEESSQTLDLTLSGRRRLMAHLKREDVSVVAKLDDVESAGVQTVSYQVSFANKRFKSSMIQERSLASATVHISELNRKIVEVRCELMGDLAPGCSAGELKLSHEALEIRGQEADIAPIAYVKVVLDIGSKASETVSQDLEFQYYDHLDQKISVHNVHPVVDTIKATLPVFVTKELQLKVDLVESPGARVSNVTYRIRPEKILVSGDAGKLNGIDSLTLGRFQLSELVGSKTYSHSYPIVISEGCQNLSGVTWAVLEVEFRDMSQATITANHFTYSNLPEGKEVEILTKELPITIYGTETSVSNVSSQQIAVEADLSNYAAASGTYTVPAKVQISTPGDVGVSGTYQVQVTIREKEETVPDQQPEPEKPETAE